MIFYNSDTSENNSPVEFYIEPSDYTDIQLIESGGWHFNYLLKPEQISKKLKSLAATQWDWGENLTKNQFLSIENIKNKINNQRDLFNRKHNYKKITIDHSFPEYILKNLDKFNEWII